MYAHNDVSNFHLGSFFRGFYFRGSRSVHENRENLHPAKISRYTVTAKVFDANYYLLFITNVHNSVHQLLVLAIFSVSAKFAKINTHN